MKKLIALLFVVAMLSVLVVMPAMAATETPTIVISNAAAQTGETATLNVSIKNNPGIVCGKVDLEYDETALELVELKTEAFSTANVKNGQVNLFTADKAVKGDVVLFTATFKVLAEGENIVSAVVSGMRNLNDELIEAEVEDGCIDDACVHVWGSYKVTRKATCSRAGEKVRTCTKCGETMKKSIAKIAHTIEVRNAKAATCTEAGYTGDEYCTVCNKVIKAGSEIAATGHKNTEVRNKKEATCTEDGYTGDTYCKDCGAKVADGEAIKAEGHSWSVYKYDEDGHWQVCNNCDAKSEKEAHEGNPCKSCLYMAKAEEGGVPVVAIVIAAVVVVAGAGAAVFFFVIKKKKA
jgi:hypothetical protein